MTFSRFVAQWFPRQVSVTHRERILSALGALAAVALLGLVSRHLLGGGDGPVLAASMGASAILLLAVPHSPFSQPWAVAGGHLVAALTGITCARFIGEPNLALGLAVGGTILLMFYLRCLHPPGGGTALLAVIGGPKIQALGYTFAFLPVLANALLLLAAAYFINRLNPHHHYPVRHHPPAPPPPPGKGFGHADLIAALEEIDEVIDVSEEDLELIYRLAAEKAARRKQSGEEAVS